MNNDNFPDWPDDFAERYRNKGYWQDRTLFDTFLAVCARNPEAIAISGNNNLSYQILKYRALSTAQYFKSSGLHSGQTVVLQLPNNDEFVIALLACFALGVIPIMAFPAHRSTELLHFLCVGDAAALIAFGNSDGSFGGLANNMTTTLEGVLYLDPRKSDDSKQLDYHAEKNNNSEQQNTQNLHSKKGAASKLALLQLSGGTTGLPKLIPRTHNDYLYSILASNRICGMDNNSRFLCVLPAAHNFCLSSPGVLGSLLAGGSLILSERSDAAYCFQVIEKYQITHTALVPPIALTWLNFARLQSNPPSLEKLRSFLVGGSKLNPTTAKALITELRAPLQQVFGMAEGLVNYTRLNDDLITACNTQGRPICEDDEIKVVDDNDNEVGVGQAGHLLTRGPYTIRGYFNADKHNARAFTSDGFYRTGDIVSVDSSGYLTVEGRDKDQINRGGEKISAAEIENYLLEHDRILDAAIIGIADDYIGERTAACLVVDSDKPFTLADCRNFLRDRQIADFKLPDKIVCFKTLPKTSFGKISKQQLRNQLESKTTYLSS